jgi:hypothetical protein
MRLYLGLLSLSITSLPLATDALAQGTITIVAGTGSFGFSGDGGPATSAELNPTDVAVDSAGNLFIADSGNRRIRRVDAATGIITTVAGTGVSGFSGDGGLSRSVLIFSRQRLRALS